MLLQLTTLDRLNGKANTASSSSPKPEDPLTCMIYFFASQMSRNLQTAAPLPFQQKPGQTAATTSVHRLDTLLAKIGVHASFSPLITQFETFPVEAPEIAAQSKWRTKPPKDPIHDTMLLVRFRSKKAREEWIETREWQDFMKQTEAEGIFRRIPHIRCARSLKGLRDPIEILSV